MFEKYNYKIVNDISFASPAVINVELPTHINSLDYGKKIEQENCLLSYKSQYLIDKNWVQTYVTRNTIKKDVIKLKKLLEKIESSCRV